jgi:hypothetical protein
MTRGGGWLMLAVLAVLLGWGVAEVYRLRVARGDVFPEYSTLRADPIGARALHDAVSLLPGRRVERWTRPAARLVAGEGDVVFLLGLRRDLEEEFWAVLDRAAVAGASVVVAWKAETSGVGDGSIARAMRDDPWKQAQAGPETAKREGDAAEERDAAEREGSEGRVREPPGGPASAHERRWGFRLSRRELLTRGTEGDAVRAEGAPSSWPEAWARWRSDLFFLVREDAGWVELYRRGGEKVMMERKRGAGRLVLLADSFPLSNEAAQRERATAVLVDLLGDARRIVFVETHLGVEAEVGVAVLARRYGLGGAALMALLLAGLWIWRRASPLMPVVAEEEELRLSIAPTAGLEALLRRSVPPAELHKTCLEAWRATASAADRARVERAALAGGAEPVEAYRAVLRALSKKHLS